MRSSRLPAQLIALMVMGLCGCLPARLEDGAIADKIAKAKAAADCLSVAACTGDCKGDETCVATCSAGATAQARAAHHHDGPPGLPFLAQPTERARFVNDEARATGGARVGAAHRAP